MKYLLLILVLANIVACKSQDKEFRKQVVFEMAVSLEKQQQGGYQHRKVEGPNK